MMNHSTVVAYFYDDAGHRIPIERGHLAGGYPYFEKAIDRVWKMYPESRGKKLFEQVDGVEFLVWPAPQHTDWSLTKELAGGYKEKLLPK